MMYSDLLILKLRNTISIGSCLTYVNEQTNAMELI